MKLNYQFLTLIICFIYTLQCFHLSFAKENEDVAIQILSKYTQFPSITESEREAGIFLEDVCRRFGLNTTIFSDSAGKFNFAASLYPLDGRKKSIVFLNHIDVVPPGDSSLWKYPPFSGIIKDDTIWGRGVIDCKGLAIMQLFAIKEFIDTSQKTELSYNVVFLCVSNEETGGKKGAQFIVNNFLVQINPVVVFGEGGAGLKGKILSKPYLTVFGISVAEKRSLWLELELKSKKYGHGATVPKKYVNKTMLTVLYKLIHEKEDLNFEKSNRSMFKEIGKLEGGFKGFFLKNIHWSIFRPFILNRLRSNPFFISLCSNTYIISHIGNPPSAWNQIPNSASAVLDCRLLPEIQTKRFIRNLKFSVMEPKLKITILDESPFAKMSKPDHYFDEFSNALKTVYKNSEVIPILFPGTTDNSYFRAKGIATYGILPVVLNDELMETAHNINERLPVTCFINGIEAYKTFLKLILFNKE